MISSQANPDSIDLDLETSDMYALKQRGSWYLESPDDQAQTNQDEQLCALRAFGSYAEAARYAQAIAAFSGRTEVCRASRAVFKREIASINNYSRNRFDGAPTDVLHCSIGHGQWPVAVSVLVSHKFNEQKKGS